MADDTESGERQRRQSLAAAADDQPFSHSYTDTSRAWHCMEHCTGLVVAVAGCCCDEQAGGWGCLAALAGPGDEKRLGGLFGLAR